MAYRVLIANVPLTIAPGKVIPIGGEVPQKLLSADDIEDLVEPQFEGDHCRAHWEVRGKGDIDEGKAPEPPETVELPAKKGKGK